MTPPPQVPQAPRLSYRARVSLMVYLLAELAAFIGMSYLIGFPYAVLLAVATTVIGGVLLRVNGLKAAREYRAAMSREEPPGTAVVSGTIGVVGSLLLVLPGFLSDLVGLLCVLPPTRFLLRSRITRFLEKRVDSPSMNRFFGPKVVRPHWGDPAPRPGHRAEDVIEGEVVDEGRPTSPRRDTGTQEDGPRSIE